jgi:DNA-binding NtrC family response regulator
MKSCYRVLLVDDEPVLLGAVRRVLERARPDAVVVYASDAATAEWQLRSTSVRLVVTDMKMASDEEAGMRVVAAACDAGVPVAVLTGSDSPAIDALAKRNVTVIRKQTMTSATLADVINRAFAA